MKTKPKQRHMTERAQPVEKPYQPKPYEAPAKKLTLESVKADHSDIVFWDTVAPLGPADEGQLAPVAKDLANDSFAECKYSDIPEPLLMRHMKGHRDYTNQGKQLQPTPDVCGLYRVEDGGLGLLLGYKAINTGAPHGEVKTEAEAR